MAILTPSSTFEGSSLGNNDTGRIILPEVRFIQLNKPEFKDGVYLYILPPYKLDRQGRGVWMNIIKVRDNFGLETKDRFFESVDSPIAYFANQAKLVCPEYAEVKTIKKDNRDTKVYPTFGRVTTRVLMNVAFAENVALGSHVIDIPSYGCADVIDNYHKKPLMGGQLPSLVCDPANATPVFFWLRKNVMGNPWLVTVEPTQKAPLPMELADTDYLYNLDDVIIKPDNEDLYEKLLLITPTDVFEACMRGYKGAGPSPVSFVTHAPAPAAARAKAPRGSAARSCR